MTQKGMRSIWLTHFESAGELAEKIDVQSMGNATGANHHGEMAQLAPRKLVHTRALAEAGASIVAGESDAASGIHFSI